MINRKTYRPVRAITTKGKLLVSLIRFLYRIRTLFFSKDYDAPLENHSEDPAKMNLKQQIYFGHKYYFKAITHQNEKKETPLFFSEKAITKNDFSKQDGQHLSLSLGGDLMPYAGIRKETCKNLWDEVGDFFFGADVVCANLETPIDTSKTASFVPEVMLKNMYFNGDEELFSIFNGNNNYKSYDVLSVANNHSLDQDEAGLVATMNFLEKKNIAHVGAAKQKADLHKFPIIEKNGIKIAFISFTYSLNIQQRPEGKDFLVNHLPLNEENPDISLVVEQVKLAREKGADCVVGFFHMGCAYQPYPSERIRKNCLAIIEATGIDVFCGGHPHNPMPLESFNCIDPFSKQQKKCLIIYSLGDFVAYDIYKACKLPLLLKLQFVKNEKGTFIDDIQAKLIYNFATITNGKISALQFLDYKSLVQHPEKLANDEAAKKEFQELVTYANAFLLKGNLDQFLV